MTVETPRIVASRFPLSNKIEPFGPLMVRDWSAEPCPERPFWVVFRHPVITLSDVDNARNVQCNRVFGLLGQNANVDPIGPGQLSGSVTRQRRLQFSNRRCQLGDLATVPSLGFGECGSTDSHQRRHIVR